MEITLEPRATYAGIIRKAYTTKSAKDTSGLVFIVDVRRAKRLPSDDPLNPNHDPNAPWEDVKLPEGPTYTHTMWISAGTREFFLERMEDFGATDRVRDRAFWQEDALTAYFAGREVRWGTADGNVKYFSPAEPRRAKRADDILGILDTPVPAATGQLPGDGGDDVSF